MVDTVRATWYPSNMSTGLDTLTYGQKQDLKQVLEPRLPKDSKRGDKSSNKLRVKQGENKMTPTTNNTQVARVTKSVFDLTEFDDIQLGKDVALPKKPESVDEALAAVNQDKQKLLDIIYEGMCADAKEVARQDMEGFRILEDGELGEAYAGKFADETKGKLINAAVLSLAKMQGYDKSKTPEQKRALKAKAMEFLRSNPAMIESLQG